MFESNTYENLLKDVLDNAPEDIDTRQGSIFYDAVSGILVKIAKLYTDLELIFSLSQIDTASGEYLDMKASEYGIERHAAVNAEYEAILIGTVA
ncbi:phage tail protein, partial [human gut metagenome]